MADVARGILANSAVIADKSGVFSVVTLPLASVASLLAGVSRIRAATSLAVWLEPEPAAGLDVVTLPVVTSTSRSEKLVGNEELKVEVVNSPDTSAVLQAVSIDD